MNSKKVVSNASVFFLMLAFSVLLQVKQQFLLFDYFGEALLFVSFPFVLVSLAAAYWSSLCTLNGLGLVAIVSLVFCLFPFLNSLVYLDRLPLGVLVSVIVCAYLALLINSEDEYSSKLLLIPFFLYAGFVVVRLFENPNPNMVFLNSKNWISYFLVLSVFPYYYRTLLFREKISYLPVVLLLLLSAYSLSRAGIISSVMMLFSVVLAGRMSKKLGVVVLVVTVVSLAYLFFLFKDLIFLNELSAENRFSISGFFKDARSAIVVEYIRALDFRSAVFGFEGREFFFKTIYSSNPHNSLLNALIGGGVFYFLLILLFLAMSFFVFLSRPLLMALVLACLARVLTDAGSFMGYFDVFLFVGFFYSVRRIDSHFRINEKNQGASGV